MDIRELFSPFTPASSGSFQSMGPQLIGAFLDLTVTGPAPYKRPQSASWSLYNTPIDTSPGRLAGENRMWGGASPEVQANVMNSIIQNSSDLAPEDQAILLGIARLESGFNPDAAATSTSAAGVFQMIKKTAESYGLFGEDRFDAESNILAELKLYKTNMATVKRRFPNLTGDDRATMLYALHHDGPSLSSDGAQIARKDLLPYLDDFRGLVSLANESEQREGVSESY